MHHAIGVGIVLVYQREQDGCQLISSWHTFIICQCADYCAGCAMAQLVRMGLCDAVEAIAGIMLGMRSQYSRMHVPALSPCCARGCCTMRCSHRARRLSALQCPLE